MRKAVRSFDARLTSFIQSWPGWLRPIMLAITDTGQPLTVILFASGLLVWALWEHNNPMAQSAMVILLTVIISTALKAVMRRARPDTEYAAAMIFKTFSFPSGHAAAATVGFGFLAYLAFMMMAVPFGIVIGCLIVLYTLLIGVSRIFLGAHFPSDVLGGMLLGGAGLAIILFSLSPLS